MKNKSKTIILVLSIIIGVVFSATGATISAVLSKNVVCVIALLVVAIFSYDYNKAILLEKIEENTRKE